MALELVFDETEKNKKSRAEIEADLFMERIFKHDEGIGAISTLTSGQPGSVKTAANLSMVDHLINTFPHDKVFWRSALHAPIQTFKLDNPVKIWIQRGSGIRLFNRENAQDITDQLEEEGLVLYFDSIKELYTRAETGICHTVFFRDLHIRDVKKDKGTLLWFRFVRFLLSQAAWSYVFFDEYQEMVKANRKGHLYWEIDDHADDVSTARKASVGLHANLHQLHEIDYRVRSGYMISQQMYGSRKDKNSPVSKKALSSLPRPSKTTGAHAWLSEGGNYGHIIYKKIYEMPSNRNIEARLIPELEDVETCLYCHRIYVPEKTKDDGLCSDRCRAQISRMQGRQSNS